MNKLKKIKSNLKKDKKWKQYKDIFINRQTRLFVSKIALTYVKDIDTDILLKWESSFMENPINESMFKGVFKELSKYSKNIDWDSFAIMLWYIYQISRYFKDLKRKNENIYIEEDLVDLNKIKRSYYMKWLNSLDKTEKEFNIKLIQINKIIL